MRTVLARRPFEPYHLDGFSSVHMAKRLRNTWCGLGSGLVLGALSACTTTVDSLGYNNVPLLTELKPIVCPSEPLNYYNEVLGKTDDECAAKVTDAINALFYGDDDTQRIYFTSNKYYTTVKENIVCDFERSDESTACIRDILHGDVRTEGLGLGMLIMAMLEHRAEFDLLWRYALLHHQITTGATAGYFGSMCDTPSSDTPRKCIDPYGLEQILMALLVANQRWGSVDASHPNYAAGAIQLLNLVRSGVFNNHQVRDDVTNTFDPELKLVYDEPNNGGQQFQRTALTIPGYYDIWAMVTGDSFYTEAAEAGRKFLATASHLSTGFYPIAANFDGSPHKDFEDFAAESFRVDLNLAIDELWGTSQGLRRGYQQGPIHRMLSFFTNEGLGVYGSHYSLDGKEEKVTTPAVELVMVNAVIAAIASPSVVDRKQYLQAAWNMPIPTAEPRYYSGIMYLMSQLILSGKFKLCR